MSRGLALADVEVSLGGLEVLRRLDLAVEPGERHALVGLNGSGKSTAIAVLAGTIAQPPARVRLDGRPIGSMPPWQRAALGITRVHQDSRLWPALAGWEHLEVVEIARASRGHPASAIARSLGLDAAQLEKLPAQLTLLERRQLSLALALHGSRFLLCDELAAGLGAAEAGLLYDALDRAIEDRWVEATLVVEHRLDLLVAHVDRVSVLEGGRIARSARGDAATLAETLASSLAPRRTDPPPFPSSPQQGPHP